MNLKIYPVESTIQELQNKKKVAYEARESLENNNNNNNNNNKK